jgi:hypothetical protein
MTRKDLHAVSVGPSIAKVPVAQPVRRKLLDRTASFTSFASIDLAPLLYARTLLLDASTLCFSNAASVPGRHHCQEANGQANLQSVAGKHEASAG